MEPIRCTILFGHWIERDAGTIPPGQALPVVFRRQVEDGALYVSRDDGRRMMVENLVCGPLDEWWPRRADIPLLPVRGSPDRAFAAACEMREDKAVCSAPEPAIR